MDNIESDTANEMFNEFKIINTQISNKAKVIYGKHEVWRTIKNYENYSVSSFGRIKNNKNRILKPGKDKDGYYNIRLYKNGEAKNYRVNRLVGIAFLLNYDNLPKVDHIDKIKTNNNIINLRFASNSQNGFNQDKCKNNTTGFKGVSFNKGMKKYVTSIYIKGKSKFLGYFQSPEEASKVYEENAKKYHGEFYYKNKN